MVAILHLFRVILLLSLLFCATEIAAEEAERFDSIAQDSMGTIWGISASRHEIASYHQGKWEVQMVDGVSRQFTPQYLQRIGTGEVVCISTDFPQRTQGVLTMHCGDKSWLRASLSLPSKFERLHILGCTDRTLVVTAAGPGIILIPPDVKEGKCLTLPDEVFHKPTPGANQSTDRYYFAIQAIEDGEHHIWFTSYDLGSENSWRLKAMVRLKDYSFQLQSIKGLEEDSSLSAIASKDEHHLWVSKSGSGLLEIDLESMTAKPSRVPDAKEFQYIEQIFYVGSECYLITTSQPTKFEATSNRIKVASTFSLSMQIFYDTTQNVGSLWMFTPAGWKLRVDGLDETPDFFQGWSHRSHVNIASGLLIRCFGSAPFYVPTDVNKSAIRLDWRRHLSLNGADVYCAMAEDTVLARKQNGEIVLARLDVAPLDESKLRAQTFRVKQGFAQTSDGRLWGFRSQSKLSEWNGDHWIEHNTGKSCEGLFALIATDDRNRIWMLNWGENESVKIFDTATGKLQTFSSCTQALQKQLPQGVILKTARDEGWNMRNAGQYFRPCYSHDGRIGFIDSYGTVFYYDGKKWKHWKPSEISPERLTLQAPPYFDHDHLLCVPAETTFRWRKKGGWEKINSSESPSYTIDKPDYSLPASCQLQGEKSVVEDRLGTLWAIGSYSPLHRAMQNLCVPVFAPEEPNPFSDGGQIYEALVDRKGNAFLRTTGFVSDFMDTFVMIRSSQAPPKTSITTESAGDDSVRIKLSSTAKNPPWYTWRLDNDRWQPLKKENEVLLTKLPKGKHQIEAEAVDDNLQVDPSPAKEHFEIRIDATKHIASLIAMLSSNDSTQRESAVQALGRYGGTALAPLRSASENADDNLRWWVEAAIQEVERNMAKAASTSAQQGQ